MAKDRSWLHLKAEELRRRLNDFESHGDLTPLSESQLLSLAKQSKQDLTDAYELWEEHQRHSPSTMWFGISALSGFGGLLLVEPITASIVITAGGALGAAKSIYDRGAHLVREQGILSLYWRANNHCSALAAETTRRGIRF